MNFGADRGDGARMSYVRVEDTPTGWTLFFDDYKDAAPFGTSMSLPTGCGAEDDFVETVIASSVSRGVHNLRFSLDLIAGSRNDVVRVYLDGSLIHTGTSWEDYFRYCEASDTSRTVDSVLIQNRGSANPGNAGNGLFVDNVSVATGDAAGRADDHRGVCR